MRLDIRILVKENFTKEIHLESPIKHIKERGKFLLSSLVSNVFTSELVSIFSHFPGKKGLEVLIQGGVIEDVAKHLIEQYGVPKRYIEVLDKTKKREI